MTRDEWCHAALHRTPITVAMEGIPDAHAVLIGWNRRGCHVQFKSGAKANVRHARVTVLSQVTGTIGAAVEAATPTSATNGRWASNEIGPRYG